MKTLNWNVSLGSVSARKNGKNFTENVKIQGKTMNEILPILLRLTKKFARRMLKLRKKDHLMVTAVTDASEKVQRQIRLSGHSDDLRSVRDPKKVFVVGIGTKALLELLKRST